MSDCSNNQHLTDEEIAQGQALIPHTMILHAGSTVYNRADEPLEYIKIFSPDNPQYPAPSVEQYGKIAYSKSADVPKDDHKHRIRTSIGRYLAKQQDIQLTCNIELASAAALGALAKFYPSADQFEILRGADLKEAYKTNVGSGSCMSGNCSDRQRMLDFYVVNQEKVGLLVWGKRRGRALLWTLPDGSYYIDKIYSGDDHAYEAYSKWACDNDVRFSHSENELRKTTDIWSESMELDLKTHITSGAEFAGEEDYPYFDSLFVDSYHPFTCYLGSGYECPDCGEETGRAATRHVEGYDRDVCRRCFEENYTTCEDCENVYPSEDGNSVGGDYGYSVCDTCIDNYDHCQRCDSNQESHGFEESEFGPTCKDCLHSMTMCHECGVYVESVEIFQGDKYCEECVPETEETTV